MKIISKNIESNPKPSFVGLPKMLLQSSFFLNKTLIIRNKYFKNIGLELFTIVIRKKKHL